MISLRPRGQHASLRRAAAARGARVLALSPVRIRQRDDKATRAALRAALAADIVVFTSPNAVRAAAALRTLRPRRGQQWCAVGAGTARALRRHGVHGVHAPERMDSAGLLALPVLREVARRPVGLVAAPGGRDRIAPALRARGARIARADVYERMPVPIAPRALAVLRVARGPLLLALSSGEALQHALATMPADIATNLRRARVAAASDRLATQARAAGFTDVAIARSAQPRDLLAVA